MKWDLRGEHKLCGSQRSLHLGPMGLLPAQFLVLLWNISFPETRNIGIQA